MSHGFKRDQLGIGWLTVKVIKPSKSLTKVIPFAGGFKRHRLVIRKGKAKLVPRRKKKSARAKKITDARRKKSTKRKSPSTKYKAYTLPQAALGPDRIISVELTEAGQHMVQMSAITGVDFRKAVNDMLANLHSQIYNWIKSKQLHYVPEDTGALRRSIIRSVRRNLDEIKYNSRIDIQLGTAVPYAAFVNQMTTMPEKGKKHVKHPPYVGKYTVGKSGKTLNDPKAIGQFYNFMLANSRKMALRLTNAEISKLYRNFKKELGIANYSQMRRLFKVRNL